MTLVTLSLDAAAPRHCRIRFRRAIAATRARLEPLDLERPFALPIGDDVPMKGAIDVLVEGNAYPNTSGETEGRLKLQVGSIDRRVRVFGKRRVVLHRGRPRFEAALAFDAIPLMLANAYGGWCTDRYYPRNAFGKGFVVEGAPESFFEQLELPNLEEEGDLLTPDRLVVPYDKWWTLPRPAVLEPVPPLVFPRESLFGLGIHSHPTDSSLPEVRDGELPAGYVPQMLRLAPGAFQEAPARSRLASVVPGTEVVLEGALPGGRVWRSKLPRSPVVKVLLDGRAYPVEPLPQTIRLRPDADEICITYAIEHELARGFIPGIHTKIPLAVEIDGQVTHYTPPPAAIPPRAKGAPREPIGGEP